MFFPTTTSPLELVLCTLLTSSVAPGVGAVQATAVAGLYVCVQLLGEEDPAPAHGAVTELVHSRARRHSQRLRRQLHLCLRPRRRLHRC